MIQREALVVVAEILDMEPGRGRAARLIGCAVAESIMAGMSLNEIQGSIRDAWVDIEEGLARSRGSSP